MTRMQKKRMAWKSIDEMKKQGRAPKTEKELIVNLNPIRGRSADLKQLEMLDTKRRLELARLGAKNLDPELKAREAQRIDDRYVFQRTEVMKGAYGIGESGALDMLARRLRKSWVKGSEPNAQALREIAEQSFLSGVTKADLELFLPKIMNGLLKNSSKKSREEIVGEVSRLYNEEALHGMGFRFGMHLKSKRKQLTPEEMDELAQNRIKESALSKSERHMIEKDFGEITRISRNRRKEAGKDAEG